jgi:hypothetical protein
VSEKSDIDDVIMAFFRFVFQLWLITMASARINLDLIKTTCSKCFRSNNIRDDCSPRSSSSSRGGGAHRTRLLLFVTTIVFAALAGTADGAIQNCIRSEEKWTQIEDGYGCQSTGWCSSGWTWASYQTQWGLCSRDGCKREVCSECAAGYHKSGLSNGFHTTCQKCSHINGCSTSVKCTTSSDSECYSCYAI